MATKNYCRSGLVRESDVSGTEDIACAVVFADKSAPTEGRVCYATARRLDDGESPKERAEQIGLLRIPNPPLFSCVNRGRQICRKEIKRRADSVGRCA